VPLRVIAADPDVDARALYRQLFGHEEFDFLEASDGRDALVKALARVPALVVSELRLPLIDGFELCEILRLDRKTASVPIIIATTETRPREIERARQLADVVIAKPACTDVLMSECARLLAKSYTLRGRFAELCVDTSESLGISATALRVAAEIREERARSSASRAHPRYTTTAPPSTTPELTCPSCDQPLTYEVSYVGGVSERHSEQWDYFICATCGMFQYRQRTRKLRPLRADEERWIDRLHAIR
jgi:CheY-like chemotaxis protein